MAVSTEDYVAIADHMARYCWAVDEGDEDGWAALWTEDGEFTGATPDPVKGREELKGVVKMSQRLGPGMMRHSITNLMCDYIDGDRDRVQANYYNQVSNWHAGARIALMALSKVQLVRQGQGWLIKRSDSKVLMG
jgi:3-phenylpropionate/cinnamic acid dioxygenase small subunit